MLEENGVSYADIDQLIRKRQNVVCINTDCLLFCTEKYKPEVDTADRACEVCILTERGLVFRGQNNKQLLLYFY